MAEDDLIRLYAVGHGLSVSHFTFGRMFDYRLGEAVRLRRWWVKIVAAGRAICPHQDVSIAEDLFHEIEATEPVTVKFISQS